MSEEDDPFSRPTIADSGDSAASAGSTGSTESGGSTEAERLEKARKELEQRERGVADFANELDEREEELDDRASDLRTERKQLEERTDELDRREARIEELEAELDKREIAIEERERELTARATELDQKEQTLQEYVNDSVRETVEAALSSGLKQDSRSRFGRIGSLVLGLVGITLIVGGVLNGFADEIAMVPTVFASDAANLAVTVLLLFSGLAANTAAVTD